MSETASLVIASLLMLPGLAGVLLPALPGIPYMFLVALAYAAITGFDRLTGAELGSLLVITVASLAVDYLAGTLGARIGGASARATVAGLLGLVLGMLVLPPLGGFLGMFIAVLYVELRSGDLARAVRAATGSLVGSLAGIAVNVVLAIVFLVVFVLRSLQ